MVIHLNKEEEAIHSLHKQEEEEVFLLHHHPHHPITTIILLLNTNQPVVAIKIVVVEDRLDQGPRLSNLNLK